MCENNYIIIIWQVWESLISIYFDLRRRLEGYYNSPSFKCNPPDSVIGYCCLQAIQNRFEKTQGREYYWKYSTSFYKSEAVEI